MAITKVTTDMIEGLDIGVDVQAHSPNLDEFATVNPSAFALDLLTEADAAAARTSLELGSAALTSYAEGSWTPVFTFVTPGTLSVTYTVQSGLYRRIGTLVTVWFDVHFQTNAYTGASGSAQITGLPFTPVNTTLAYYPGSLAMRLGVVTSNDVSCQVINNVPLIRFGDMNGASGTTTLGTPGFPASTTFRLIGTISYPATL